MEPGLNPISLTHLFPVHLSSTTLRFSVIFIWYRKGALGTNGLITKKERSRIVNVLLKVKFHAMAIQLSASLRRNAAYAPFSGNSVEPFHANVVHVKKETRLF